jgi:hypothetical protein
MVKIRKAVKIDKGFGNCYKVTPMNNIIKIIACFGLLAFIVISLSTAPTNVSAGNVPGGSSTFGLQNANRDSAPKMIKPKLKRKHKTKGKTKRHYYKTHKTK